MDQSADSSKRKQLLRSVLSALNDEEPNKDNLLHSLLQVLATRGIARKWAESRTPYSDLDYECTRISSNTELAHQFGVYLRQNPVIRLSVQSFLAHISVASNVQQEQIPYPQQLLIPVGKRIARWLPTFLIIDGPLGRFLRATDSPLSELLKKAHETYPSLAQARDTFNHDIFRRVRNGVGHWAFAWEMDSEGERLVCFNWESGERIIDVSLLEAEALHVVSFSVIECLDQRIFDLAKENA